MKKFLFIVALATCVNTVYSQTDSVKAEEGKNWSVGLDLVAPYFWRGQRLVSNNKIAFQPYASYTIAKKLTIGVWGTTNFGDDTDGYQEFDWYVKYQMNDAVALMVSDYYFPAQHSNGGPGTHYFDYDYGAPHVMDATILVNFKGFDFQWNTIFNGNDFKNVEFNTDDTVKSKKRAFSSYAELGYAKELGSTGLTLRPFIGVAVINEAGFYGFKEPDSNGNQEAGLNFSNVGARLIWAAPWSENWTLPIWLNYSWNQFGIANPQTGEYKHSFISVGTSFVF